MSNINTAAKVRNELEELESKKTREVELANHFEELNEIKREIENYVLTQYGNALKEEDPGLIELVLYLHAEQELGRRKQGEVANEVLFNVKNWRWWADKISQVAIEAGAAALGIYLLQKFGNTNSEEIPGTEINPFSDTTAAPPRPSNKRRADVVPFDRQAG